MSADWQLVVHEPSLRFLLSCSSRERDAVLELLSRLVADPSQPGDFEEIDESGRLHQAKVSGRWCVTYWPDHAVKELRVVRLERLD